MAHLHSRRWANSNLLLSRSESSAPQVYGRFGWKFGWQRALSVVVRTAIMLNSAPGV